MFLDALLHSLIYFHRVRFSPLNLLARDDVLLDSTQCPTSRSAENENGKKSGGEKRDG